MPLVPAYLSTVIENLVLGYNATATQESKDQIKQFADDLAGAITDYIKTGTVITTVVGSSATGGPVTGTGTGSIS
ncbi:MAG: hypothetical protein AAF620_00245 [Bacteroidota bacterium]